MGYRIEINYDLCDSQAECCRIAPEVFELDGDDMMQVRNQRPGDELRAKVESAARGCPKGSISLVDD